VYFVDRYGEKADLTGLNQGLFDVLQDAGVITNDWQFRTSDGTRIVFGDEHPRVEITITNLPQE
jgi:Holliday junction resolvase RusA-like endonuclease